MRRFLQLCSVLLWSHVGLSCGINWSEPHGPVEGCNEQGYVFVTEKLAEIAIPGETQSIPIWATFDSSRQVPSPYGGVGWNIPFLESHMAQLSEDEFIFTDPGGWRRLFRRQGKNSDILDGGGGWKGQIFTDRIMLWANCGWRVELHKGKITQLTTPHNQVISYNYTNGKISRIICGFTTLISVDSNEGTDHKLGIDINGKRFFIAQTDRPQVQRISGVNVIQGKDESFFQLTGPDKQTRTFTYDVDEQLYPTLTIADAKTSTKFTWDPATRRIKRLGSWSYNITPGESAMSKASIVRTNSEGQAESWQRSDADGSEIIQQADGVKHIKTWYVSGSLAGLTRKVEQVKNGETEILDRYVYDEKGRVVRSERTLPTGKNGETRKVYTKSFYDIEKWDESLNSVRLSVEKYIDVNSIKTIKATSPNEQNWEYSFFDANGSNVARMTNAGTAKYSKFEQGVRNSYCDGKLLYSDKLNSDGRIEKRLLYASDGKTIEQTQQMTYDPAEKKETIVISDATQHSPNVVVNRSFDNMGRISEYTTNGYGYYSYVYDTYGKRAITFIPIKSENIPTAPSN